MTAPPAPLEWHPAYRDQTWLLDWLEGRGEHPTHCIQFPIVPAMRAIEPHDESSTTEMLPMRTLTKQRAWGAAPYVGLPFRYEWFFATDELGRTISGEARLRYADPDFTFPYGPFEYAHEARNGHDPDTPVWP